MSLKWSVTSEMDRDKSGCGHWSPTAITNKPPWCPLLVVVGGLKNAFNLADFCHLQLPNSASRDACDDVPDVVHQATSDLLWCKFKDLVQIKEDHSTLSLDKTKCNWSLWKEPVACNSPSGNDHDIMMRKPLHPRSDARPSLITQTSRTTAGQHQSPLSYYGHRPHSHHGTVLNRHAMQPLLPLPPWKTAKPCDLFTSCTCTIITTRSSGCILVVCIDLWFGQINIYTPQTMSLPWLPFMMVLRLLYVKAICV